MKVIMIVDDDIYIGDVLQDILTREGYEVVRAYSGTEALLYLKQHKPDLILLDLMLPGLSGEEILPHIKTIPVIVVSAKVNISDKVNLLLEGAVDYITKPFDTNELLARIHVQLRKSSVQQNGDILTFKNIEMNLLSHLVTVADVPIKLTKTEYSILKLLLQNPKQVLTKSMILDQISLETPDCMESSLKVHISHLRKKLKEIDSQDYIEAVWGIGFKMRI